MRRWGDAEQRWPELAAGAVGALWRLRLEFVLAAALVGSYVLLAGLAGDVGGGLVLAALVGSLWAVSAVRG